jgi:hypothetical protein
MGLAQIIAVATVLTAGWAATPYKQSLATKKNIYAADGVFVGGKAAGGTSLLNVRRVFAEKSRIERVTLDIGDKDARPAGRDIGYFQVSVDSKDNRIVVDLSQLKLSRVSETAVQNLFKKSPYVASASLTLDPEDKAGTLVLNLKRPVKVEVFQMLKDRAPGKIVMDLTPRS